MKKFKLLTASLVATSILGTSSVFMSSCSNADDQLAKDIIKKAVEEFVEIAKIPRPFKHTAKVREYLKERIAQLGYTPIEGPKSQDEKSDGRNLWFDVPATPGYENHKKIILQAHMDMVFAYDPAQFSNVPNPEETKIEVEFHEDTYSLTSKNKKTSLGADDGIGIGLIFALLQNQEIKHGPIRVIFTYDEEKGMTGAKQLTANEIDANYLISLDGELQKDGYYRSCQGTVGCEYDTNFGLLPTESANTFDMYIHGFKGGHSGNDINSGRCNSNVFAMNVLKELNDPNLQLISFNINENGETLTQNRNSIPNFARVKFITSKNNNQISTAFEQTKTKFKTEFYGEDWVDVKYDLIPKKESLFALDADVTDKIINLFCNDNGMCLHYGTLAEDPGSKRPLLSCNIAPVYLANSDGAFHVETYARCVSKNGIDFMSDILPIVWNYYFPTSTAISLEPTYPWERNDDDQMQKLADSGYKSIGIDPYIRDTNGSVEPAWFSVKKPSLQQTCMGTFFENVHTYNETCYLKPLKNTVKVLKYIFENLK